jgi:rhamnogalacturonyl hydrolase YesR
MKYNTRFVSFVLLLLININKGFFAQDDSLRKEIISVLNECADYAVDVLLDEEGKSRCDYNLIEGKWYAYEPPWHTGQVINGLVEAYKISKNEKYLNAAKKAGDWWCSLLITDHPKLKGMLNAVHGDGVEDIIFATVSDGTPGLFNLYEVTGTKKYAEVPTSAGKWMLENMYLSEKGVFYDAIDAKTGEVKKENSPFWPDKKEQKLFDVSRPNNEGSLFKDMYEFTKDVKYKKVFIELCESLVEKQDEHGLWMDFMPNHKEEGTYHPRFNLWYAESLLEGYDLTGDNRYLDAAKKTLTKYQKAQRKEGTIFYKNYLDDSYNENSITGSAVAFAGMLWIRLVKYGVGEEFKTNIKKSYDWIVKNRFSINHPDENLRGAVINLRTRRKKGKIWMTQRDVGTSFSLRFLAEYYNYMNEDNLK